MSKQKIYKLYFNKWPYKIACEIVGATKVKYAGPARIRMWANIDSDVVVEDTYRWSIAHASGHKRKTIDKFELLKFSDAVEPFMKMKKDVQIRVEGAHFNLFCKDTVLKNKICQDLAPWIKDVYGPETEEELEFMLGNHKKVLCNHLPHGKFKFKVVLKDWVKDPKKKEALYRFLYNQGTDKVKISGESLRWLAGGSNYKQEPFFYLLEEKQLTFIRLVFSDIKTVYEYVERDGINTVLQ